ncbi:hypothetical protein CHS0354_004005 [Potamilus streckersoni]|uniref:Uncharacterized protein n=1 Tax=Potamilus streckersoni TaxID=2493646 RepID=A0AAE0S162_9BIVA|nr:hypothetical protein CHS0354_004005 [Potamilus streckersoni]
MDAEIDLLSGGVQTLRMLQELPEADRWCLAFCMDKVKGSNLTHMLFPNDAHTMLSELIGPVEQCIGDAAVPTKFMYLGTVCIFLDKLACVFCSMGLDDLLINGLKFFVQNYQQKLCDHIVEVSRRLPSSRKDKLSGANGDWTIENIQLYLICTRKRQVHDVIDSLEGVAEHLNLGNKEKMQLYQAQAASLD